MLWAQLVEVAYHLADERVGFVGVEGDRSAKEVLEGNAEERREW